MNLEWYNIWQLMRDMRWRDPRKTPLELSNCIANKGELRCSHSKTQCLPLAPGEPFLQVSVQMGKHADPSLSLHQTGDQIVEVNGIDFSNLDHKEVRCVVFACWPLSPLPSTSRLFSHHGV